MNSADEPQPNQSPGRADPPKAEVCLPASPIAAQVVQRLSSQLAEAYRNRAVSQLDLEWELERRQFCRASDRFPNGEVPTRSSASGFLAVGALFLMGIGFACFQAGFIFLLLFFPIVAFSVLLVAHGAQQFSRASRYNKALARYETRRDSITHAAFQPPNVTGCKSSNAAGERLAVQQLADEVAETRYQAELARLDKEWEIELQKHYIYPRRGKRPYLPTSQGALVSGGICLVIGVLLMLIKSPGPVAFGLFLVVLGIGGGLYEHARAKEYERAHAAHQLRRKQLSSEQFRPESQPSNSSTTVA